MSTHCQEINPLNLIVLHFQKAKKPSLDDISLDSPPEPKKEAEVQKEDGKQPVASSESSLVKKPTAQFPVLSGSNKLAAAMNVPVTNSSTSVAPRQRPRGSAAVPSASGASVALPPLPSPSQPKPSSGD